MNIGFIIFMYIILNMMNNSFDRLVIRIATGLVVICMLSSIVFETFPQLQNQELSKKYSFDNLIMKKITKKFEDKQK